MKLKATTKQSRTHSAEARALAAFTLAEVLAAMLFMAILIPVAVEGLRIAGLAGVVAQRKALAMRVAERMLNETVVLHLGDQAVRNGTVQEGACNFTWNVRSELWKQDTMRQVSAEVKFTAQGREYTVDLTTLVEQ